MADIEKAQRIKDTFEAIEKEGKGAYGLEGVMIDAPVYKQVTSPEGAQLTAGFEGVDKGLCGWFTVRQSYRLGMYLLYASRIGLHGETFVQE